MTSIISILINVHLFTESVNCFLQGFCCEWFSFQFHLPFLVVIFGFGYLKRLTLPVIRIRYKLKFIERAILNYSTFIIKWPENGLQTTTLSFIVIITGIGLPWWQADSGLNTQTVLRFMDLLLPDVFFGERDVLDQNRRVGAEENPQHGLEDESRGSTWGTGAQQGRSDQHSGA